MPAAQVLGSDAADPAAGDELAASIAGIGGLDGLWLNAGYADVCNSTRAAPSSSIA